VALIETLGNLAARAGHDLSAPVAMERAQANVPADWGDIIDVGARTWTGRPVNANSAMALPVFWACVRLRADSVARLPLRVFRATRDARGRYGREEARDSALWPLMANRVNEHLTSFRFRRLMQTWLDMTGNAYAEIETNRRGEVVALWPWRPDRVEVEMTPNGPRYEYTTEATRFSRGERVVRDWPFILHLRGVEGDGLKGLDPIRAHRQTLAHAAGMREYSARFFAQGARPSGVLESPEKLSDAAYERLRKQHEARVSGLDNAHRIMILEEGLKWNQVSSRMVDAEFVAQSVQSGYDVCRIFEVPPHMVGLLDRSTNNNIEEQRNEWHENGLGNQLSNWEAELNHMLTPRIQKPGAELSIRFYRTPVGQATLRDKGEYIGRVRQWGVATANEVRNWLDLDPSESPMADELLVAANIAGKQQQEVPAP